MTHTRHITFNIEADGHMERREGQMPAVIKRSPVSVTIIDGSDEKMAARLLRRLTDELKDVGKHDARAKS